MKVNILCSRIYGGDYGIVGSGKKTDFEGYALPVLGTKTYNQTDPSIDFSNGNNVANILWSEHPNWNSGNRMIYYSNKSWPYNNQLKDLRSTTTINLDDQPTNENNESVVRADTSPFYTLENSTGSFCNPNWLSFKKTPTSSIETLIIDDLIIFPNPVSQLLSIKLPEPVIHNNYVLTIHNHLGQRLLTKAVAINPESLDVSTLNKGMYFLNIRTQEGKPIYTKKFIKL